MIDDDALAENEATIRELARKAMRNAFGGPRPTIAVVPGRLPLTVDSAEMALMTSNVDIYQRGTMLVRPGTIPIDVSGKRVVHAQYLAPVSAHGLVEILTFVAEWVDASTKNPRPIDCPLLIAKVYLASAGQWRLPMLAGVISCPTLRRDGSILQEPGYDPGTGLLFEPENCSFEPIKSEPTKDDAARALGVLRELIAGFPFVKAADRAVALSAILTAPIRRSLTSAPMHAFTAPAAGTGKSLLVDIASVIATGHEAGVIEEGDEVELPKRLGAAFLRGAQLVTIDNCEKPLGGGFLCQALTQRFLDIRLLGTSENHRVRCDTFLCATGNNLRIVGDMTRRTILCSLDAQCERPELRLFASHPVALAKAGRAKYVNATLTILRAYHVAGRPVALGSTGSFDDWSNSVRGALVWLGEADPWSTVDAIRGGDPQLGAITAVMAQWADVLGEERVTTRELIEKATERQWAGPFNREEFRYPDFREALLAVAGKGGAINGRSLGIWLGSINGRVVAGRKIADGGVIHGSRTWRLEKV
jgi:hypothetical protein